MAVPQRLQVDAAAIEGWFTHAAPSCIRTGGNSANAGIASGMRVKRIWY
jgi:hypothetical protein